MINSVKQEIVNRLKQLYPSYTVYNEDIPQRFKKPSFLINLIDQDYEKRMNRKFDSILSFDIAYFSNLKDVKGDCQETQLELFRNMDSIGAFRVLNKQAIVTDNVLHFTFNINYSEIMDESYIKMLQSQIIERTEV